MESEFGEEGELGRVMVTLCFIDLTGFTRFTEEEGDEEALDLIERFVDTVEATPAPGGDDGEDDRRRGDGRLARPSTLVEWTVGFLSLFQDRPQPRAGIHYGRAVFRDGDYFGTDVNLAHRVVDPGSGRGGARHRPRGPVDQGLRVSRVRTDRGGRAEGLPGADRLFIVSSPRAPQPK